MSDTSNAKIEARLRAVGFNDGAMALIKEGLHKPLANQLPRRLNS